MSLALEDLMYSKSSGDVTRVYPTEGIYPTYASGTKKEAACMEPGRDRKDKGAVVQESEAIPG